MRLNELGWDERFERDFSAFRTQGLQPARIAGGQRGRFILLHEGGESPAALCGRLQKLGDDPLARPVVGDWVACSPDGPRGMLLIRQVLPRRTQIVRAAVGERTQPQLLAANVDLFFLVTGLDRDFKPRRIERFLALAWESGVTPVIVLNKADLCPDLESAILRAENAAIGATIVAISALDAAQVTQLAAYLGNGRTGVLLGSSGAGKSTIVNALIGEERQKVSAVRAGDGRGRHTTTARRLIPLPAGGMLIDTPGLREVKLWGEESSVDAVFADIGALAAGCRFDDCTHTGEPDCAVQAAVARGELEMGRYENYLQQLREARYQRTRTDQFARLAEKRRWQSIMKSLKTIYRLKGK